MTTYTMYLWLQWAGSFEELLQREFEVALHLPCWVGPKDESVYVYLPR